LPGSIVRVGHSWVHLRPRGPKLTTPCRYRDLQSKICHHEKVQTLTGADRVERLVDAEAVNELLDDLGHDPVKAAVLAVLIARIGLSTFCTNAPAPS